MTDTRIDPLELRRALGAFVTGVTIVTTTQADGTPRGFTANSFTSVSLDPPLVLVCLGYGTSSYPVFAEGRPFAVNILAETQRDVSAVFASKVPDKFAAVRWRGGVAGAPVLESCAAHVECLGHARINAGDHAILIGRVVDLGHTGASPLVYLRGNYFTLGQDQSALIAPHGTTRVGAILEHAGRLLLVEDPGSGRVTLPSGAGIGSAADPRSLRGALARLGVAADLGFVFAVFEESGGEVLNVYYRGEVSGEAPTGDGSVLVEHAAIPWDLLPDEAIRSMLRRYVAERVQDQFGVYVGDATAGTIQSLA
ncbi:MAG: flavin reductase family protein [Chloroflexota bacterium]|nr:flavin reductase family protein [Chloroflexota bacterium]